MDLGHIKSIDARLYAAQGSDTGLRRVLGRIDLVLMGVGVIVGGGIFVITGTAAAQYAGPAIVFSFLIAGLGCALCGLCYAELAAMIPASGSAYTYAYVALGEIAAWLVAWNLVAEYVFAASYVAIGWSGYYTSLMAQWGIPFPAALASAPLRIEHASLSPTGALINLPALSLAVAMALVAIRGVRLSRVVNGAIVLLKLGALLLVIGFGSRYIDPDNWSPFLPPNQGASGHFGWSGVLRGAAVVFVSYLGFDAIATMAQETRRPDRDLPVGILGALALVSLIYIAVSLVLTGLVPYAQLDAANPLSVAISSIGPTLAWLVPVVDAAAVIGLGSVVLIIMLAQPRVLLAMGRDGLLPAVFARIHERFCTPHWATAVCGLIVAVLAGLFPLSVLVQLVSVGTLIVFIVVCLAVIVLRRAEPHRARPFRVPLGPVIPLGGILVCSYLLSGIPAQAWAVYGIWLALGVALYALHGRRSAARLRARASTEASAASIRCSSEIGSATSINR